MNDKYIKWINDYKTSLGDETVMGKCGQAAEAMVVAFPELRKARGTVFDLLWGERTHWWCVAPNGEIVDPTVSQFPCLMSGSYAELKDGDPIPSGVCMDCGETVYDGATFCNSRCEEATRQMLGQY